MKTKNIIILGSSIAVLFFIIYWNRQRKNNSPKVFYRKKPVGNYNGYIVPPFGIVIKETERDNKEFLEHEMTHWRQWQKGGLTFLIDWIREQRTNGYELNKYEIEARKKSGETKYCQTNYTNCVRNGKAKAYNPNFRKNG